MLAGQHAGYNGQHGALEVLLGKERTVLRSWPGGRIALQCTPMWSFVLFPPGISGDWKNHFTVAQNERFNRHYEEQMKGLALRFRMEI